MSRKPVGRQATVSVRDLFGTANSRLNSRDQQNIFAIWTFFLVFIKEIGWIQHELLYFAQQGGYFATSECGGIKGTGQTDPLFRRLA